jgi:hypothetical protein
MSSAEGQEGAMRKRLVISHGNKSAENKLMMEKYWSLVQVQPISEKMILRYCQKATIQYIV